MRKINFIIILNIVFIIISLSDVSFSQGLPLNKQDTILSDTSEAVIIKDAFRVNSLEGEYGADQSGIIAAIDGEGNFAFVWIDQRFMDQNVFCQFYNKDGEKIGSNNKVNSISGVMPKYPSIDANDRGDFVVVWAQDLFNIKAQRYNSSGEKVGAIININLSSDDLISSPDVAINNDGSFVVTWVALDDASFYKIVSRYVDPFGSFTGSNLDINDKQLIAYNDLWQNSISEDGSGNFCVVWYLIQPDSSSIILQKLNTLGEKIGSNIIVSTSEINSSYFSPQTHALNDGKFLITWINENILTYYKEIYFRLFDSNTNEFTNIDNINYTDYSLSILDIASDSESNFNMIIGDYSNSFSVQINNLGELKYAPFKYHFNTELSIVPFSHRMTNVIGDSLYLAFEYYYADNLNIGFQKFSGSFSSTNNIEKINDDTSNADQKNSLVKFNSKGGSIIVWEDRRNGGKDLYAQVYDPLFNPIGGNIQINEGTNTEILEIKKSIGSFSDGTFVIGFNSLDASHISNFYLQRVSTTGEKLGSNVYIKANTSYPGDDFSFGVNNNDQLIFCSYNNNYVITRRTDSELNFISSSEIIKHTSDNMSFDPIKVSIDTSLNILLIWKYFTDSNIYGESYNKYGDLIESQFTIDYSYLDSDFLNLICKNDGLNAVILFKKDDNQYNLVRRYNDSGIYKFTDPINSTSSFLKYNILKFENKKTLLAINEESKAFAFYANDNYRRQQFYHLYNYPEDNYTSEPRPLSIDCKGDNFILSYETAVSYTGEDIWSSIVKVDSLNMGEEYFFSPPASDYLYNNFPNPFNPMTKIVYEILAYHQVKLSILNILGEEVKVLVNENQEKGLYEVNFDATGLASGVYFCKLEAFNTTVKKMIVLK